MPKTQEELTQLKAEYETLNNKLKELTEEELNIVKGGFVYDPFEKLEGRIEQDVNTSKHEEINIHGLETIGPYATSIIPLDSDSKLKSNCK